MKINNEEVVRVYYIMLYSYSNFFYGDYEEGLKEYDNVKDCYKDIIDDKRINRDLHKSMDEPICYYRIRKCYETNDTLYIEDYAIRYHRNGRVSLYRKDA